MNRQDAIAAVLAWDPESGEDLPDAVATAIDVDPEVRACFDARFVPTEMEEPPMPAGLAERLAPLHPADSQPFAPVLLLVAMTLLAIGISGWTGSPTLGGTYANTAHLPVGTTALRVVSRDPVVQLFESVHGTTGGPLRRAPWPGGAMATISAEHTLVTELYGRGYRPPAGLVSLQGLLDGVRWTSPQHSAEVEMVEAPDDPDQVLALVRVRVPTHSGVRHDLAVGLDLSARTASLQPVAEAIAAVADALPPGGAVGVVGAAGRVFVEPGDNIFHARLHSLVPATRPGVARALEPAADMAREFGGHVVLVTDAADDHPTTWALAVQRLRVLRGFGTQVHIVGLELDPSRRRLVAAAAELGGASYADANVRSLEDVLIREMYRASPSESLQGLTWRVGAKRVVPHESPPTGEVAAGVRVPVVASLVRIDRADLQMGGVTVDLAWSSEHVESVDVHVVLPFELASEEMVTAAAWEQVSVALRERVDPSVLRQFQSEDPRAVEAVQVLRGLL